MRSVSKVGVAVLVAFLAGCGEKNAGSTPEQANDAPAAAPEAAAPQGKVIEVKLITDDKGNRFEPSAIEADRGDIIRLTLVTGVHNLSFPAEKNPGATGLPEPSPMLQLPGQTHDIPLNFAPGHYAFQCDPHAALGMTGTLEIEDD